MSFVEKTSFQVSCYSRRVSVFSTSAGSFGDTILPISFRVFKRDSPYGRAIRRQLTFFMADGRVHRLLEPRFGDWTRPYGPPGTQRVGVVPDQKGRPLPSFAIATMTVDLLTSVWKSAASVGRRSAAEVPRRCRAGSLLRPSGTSHSAHGLTSFAPILISFSRKLVSVQVLNRSRRHERS